MVTGPRQSGKTTLLRNLLEKHRPYLFLDGDDPTVRQLLTGVNTEGLRQIIGRNTVVFIDEAQRIPNIGLTLKIVIDQFPQVQLLVSGSSSFDLGNQLNEPLTGRKWEYQLFPISWKELEDHLGFVRATQQLEQRIIFGMYPDIINRTGEEEELLKSLSGSYLFKDILSIGTIRKPEVLEPLLQALALQLGNEVSLNELANHLQIDKNTVASYLDIMERAYIIFRLGPLSRNLRNEIRTSRKIYFYDTGIRNALIGDFSPMSLRPDKGALWENFLITERKKHLEYNKIYPKSFFWRLKTGGELDYVESKDGKMTGYEFKWKQGKSKVSNAFRETYQGEVRIITSESYREFLGG